MGYRFCYNCEHEFYESYQIGNKCPQCGTVRWGLLHRKQMKAHAEVGRAVRSGRLIKGPCQVCGSTVRIEGHHDDYSKPLEVIWLCRPHHGQRHVELKRLGKDPNLAIRFKSVGKRPRKKKGKR